MFLVNLKEEQKLAFLDLAHALIAADGVLSDDEVSMLEQYKQEMALIAVSVETLGQIEQAVGVFKTVPATLKKQVVFELVALAYADNNYVAEEDSFLNEIVVSLGLETAFIDECRVYVGKLTELYEQIEKLVSE